ncbi:MAG: hypothetical protein ACLPSW_27590 [Roseiarcus sp.]
MIGAKPSPRALRSYAAIVGLWALVVSAAPALAQPCCGPITPDGRRLAAFLNSTGVDHLWIAGHHIAWDTGQEDAGRPDGREEKTHCSAFAAAVAARLGVYVLRPPDHEQELLANAQMSWLAMSGSGQGWRTLHGYLEAQQAANRGELVLEAFENLHSHRSGHVAVVRPSDKTLAELDRDGPQETQAGGFNALSTTTAKGFRSHRGAWIPDEGGSLGYYAHAIDWSAVR